MPSNYLRQTLFALLLAIGQLLLVAHAVEHAAGGEEGLAASAHCERCLLGQNLGHALPSVLSLDLPSVQDEAPLAQALPVSRSADLPALRQGAPPISPR